MKITKNYLRQMIVESLEENKELPYEEFISKAVDIFHNERFYSDKMIQLFNTVNRETLKKIVKQAESDSSQKAADFNKMVADMKSLSFIAKKLSDGPQDATSNRYSDEPGISVAENKKLSKDVVRQMIRESLQESKEEEYQKRVVAAAAQRFLPPNPRPAAGLDMLKRANISPKLAMDYAFDAMVQHSSSPKSEIYEEAYNKLIDALKKANDMQ